MPWLLRLWRQRMERPVEATPALRKRTARRVFRRRETYKHTVSGVPKDAPRHPRVSYFPNLCGQRAVEAKALTPESLEIAKRLSGVQRQRDRRRLDPGHPLTRIPGAEKERKKKKSPSPH